MGQEENLTDTQPKFFTKSAARHLRRKRLNDARRARKQCLIDFLNSGLLGDNIKNHEQAINTDSDKTEVITKSKARRLRKKNKTKSLENCNYDTYIISPNLIRYDRNSLDYIKSETYLPNYCNQARQDTSNLQLTYIQQFENLLEIKEISETQIYNTKYGRPSKQIQHIQSINVDSDKSSYLSQLLVSPDTYGQEREISSLKDTEEQLHLKLCSNELKEKSLHSSLQFPTSLDLSNHNSTDIDSALNAASLSDQYKEKRKIEKSIKSQIFNKKCTEIPCLEPYNNQTEKSSHSYLPVPVDLSRSNNVKQIDNSSGEEQTNRIQLKSFNIEEENVIPNSLHSSFSPNFIEDSIILGVCNTETNDNTESTTIVKPFNEKTGEDSLNLNLHYPVNVSNELSCSLHINNTDEVVTLMSTDQELMENKKNLNKNNALSSNHNTLLEDNTKIILNNIRTLKNALNPDTVAFADTSKISEHQQHTPELFSDKRNINVQLYKDSNESINKSVTANTTIESIKRNVDAVSLSTMDLHTIPKNTNATLSSHKSSNKKTDNKVVDVSKTEEIKVECAKRKTVANAKKETDQIQERISPEGAYATADKVKQLGISKEQNNQCVSYASDALASEESSNSNIKDTNEKLINEDKNKVKSVSITTIGSSKPNLEISEETSLLTTSSSISTITTMDNKTVVSEKTRKEIKAEREAKKAAKAAAKAKGKINKPNSKSSDDKSILVNAKGELTNHLEISKEQSNTSVRNDNTESSIEGKSKAELRAERRAKQEAQRAAKQELASEKIKSKDKDISKPFIDAAPDDLIKKVNKKIITKENDHEVNLFKHLYHERDPAIYNISMVNSNIHPAIVKLGVQYASKVIVGSNARCVALLGSVKQLIQDFEKPSHVDFIRGLEASLQEAAAYLNHCRPLAVSMQNALRHLKWQMTQLLPTLSDSDAKNKLRNAIDTYILEQIQIADKAISMTIQTKISNGNVILTYGYSSLIHKILLDAHAIGKQFRVIVVDGRPWLEGKEQLRRLAKHGIECSYILISALSFVMPEVSKVFLGAHAILANGAVMSRVGTAQVALMARAFNVPVLVACETHKSCERVQTDSIVYNELGDADDLTRNLYMKSKMPLLDNWRTKKYLNLLNITYDVTPADLVTAVVTELAILPCTSVPVILRIKPSEI